MRPWIGVRSAPTGPVSGTESRYVPPRRAISGVGLRIDGFGTLAHPASWRPGLPAAPRVRSRIRRPRGPAAPWDTLAHPAPPGPHVGARGVPPGLDSRGMRAEELEVAVMGEGPPVVLVHGSVIGRPTWRRQEALAEHFELHIVSRPGFGGSPPLARGDFEREAPLMAELLGGGAHLVGHSYGAVIALYAAALAPGAVRSLTVSEPGCLAVAGEDRAAAEMIAGGRLLYARAGELDPREFLLAFRGGAGSIHETSQELEGELLEGVRLLARERPAWEADPPLELLAAQPFPKLVISGGHSAVFERVCDEVAARTGARRAVLSGRGHTIPATGERYNGLLRDFLTEAERAAA